MSGAGAFPITGMGVISPAGLGVAPLFDACLKGQTLLRHVSDAAGPTGRVGDEFLTAARVAVKASRWAHLFAATSTDDASLARHKPALMTAYALTQALPADGSVSLADGRTGLILATTTGHMHRWETTLPDYVRGDLDLASFVAGFGEHHLGCSLDDLITRGGFSGPLQVLTSACAAGTQALALAHAWLAAGKVERVLVGATEILTTLTQRGFGCFNLLAPGVAAPFDAQRCGINLSEASVFFRIERRGDASRFTHGYLRGGGVCLDAFDMTRPHPEGRGLHGAMQSALDAAGLSPDAVDWVYAHGTGTPANDSAEATAIAMTFGQRRLPVTSTKAVHGHALGASGLLETAVALAALRQQVVPPTTNLRTPDPAIAALAALATPEAATPSPAVQGDQIVMKTTLGFGGVNAAVLLSRDAPRPPVVAVSRPAAAAPVLILAAAVADAQRAAIRGDQAEFRKATQPMLLAADAVANVLAVLPASARATLPSWGAVVGVDHGELEVTKEFLCALAERGIARPFLFQNSLHNATLGFLSLHFGLRGPGATTCTRYFGGEDALALACDYVRSGAAAACLVVGVEALDPAMQPAAAALLVPHASPGNGAAALIVATPAFAAAQSLMPLAQLQSIVCERAPGVALPDRPLTGYYGADAVAHLARAVAQGETSLALTKPDGARSLIRWSRA